MANHDLYIQPFFRLRLLVLILVLVLVLVSSCY